MHPCFTCTIPLKKELVLNTCLGMGEFGVVLEVENIHLGDPSTSEKCIAARPLHRFNSKSCGAFPTFHHNHYDCFGELLSCGQMQQLRQTLASEVNRETEETNDRIAAVASTVTVNYKTRRRSTGPRHQARFAVKQIRKDMYPKKKIEAGKDLAREAKLLSRMEHPNIIRLRAVVRQPGEDDFMLLLDRLGITLSEKVTQWHHQVTSTSTGLALPWKLAAASSQRRILERCVLSERLLALYDVARAMHYLHQKFILFRDLKTENVAQSHHGAFQLLDFGLAKEVKERDRFLASTQEEGDSGNDTDYDVTLQTSCCKEYDDVYKLTGLTGTMRIMSPEVLQCHPYGLSADVYSYGILLWEVFQGERNRLAPHEIVKGQRPELPVPGMPPRIESLVKKCYGSPAFRPTFAMLSQELEYQLIEFHQAEWPTEADTNVSMGLEKGIMHRLAYLRELSLRSLATSTSAVTAVEN